MTRDNASTRSDLDHIARTELPWRTGLPRTECGLTNTPALTTDEFVDKARREGQRRTALTTCMTCYDKRVMFGRLVNRDGLVDVLGREVRRVNQSRDPDASRELENELQAIAALIDAHRAEFDATLEGIREAPTLDDVRRRRAQQGRSPRGA